MTTIAQRVAFLAAEGGLSDPEIAAIIGISREHAGNERRRALLPSNGVHKEGRPRSEIGDAMVLAYERCGNYSLVARAFCVTPSTVFETVRRRRRDA